MEFSKHLSSFLFYKALEVPKRDALAVIFLHASEVLRRAAGAIPSIFLTKCLSVAILNDRRDSPYPRHRSWFSIIWIQNSLLFKVLLKSRWPYIRLSWMIVLYQRNAGFSARHLIRRSLPEFSKWALRRRYKIYKMLLGFLGSFHKNSSDLLKTRKKRKLKYQVGARPRMIFYEEDAS